MQPKFLNAKITVKKHRVSPTKYQPIQTFPDSSHQYIRVSSYRLVNKPHPLCSFLVTSPLANRQSYGSTLEEVGGPVMLSNEMNRKLS